MTAHLLLTSFVIWALPSEPCLKKAQVITDSKLELCSVGGRRFGATSFLPHKKQPLRYSPKNLIDGKLETTWADGKKGAGIGEKVAFELPKNAETIRVFPGIRSKRNFRRNNRLRKVYLSIFEIDAGGSGAYRVKKKIVDRLEFSFLDEMLLQALPTRPPPNSGNLIGVLEIVSVYKGTKWDDTCIAEISFTKAKPKTAPVLGEWYSASAGGDLSLSIAAQGECSLEHTYPEPETSSEETKSFECSWSYEDGTMNLSLEAGAELSGSYAAGDEEMTLMPNAAAGNLHWHFEQPHGFRRK